jgi:hypothetical protein
MAGMNRRGFLKVLGGAGLSIVAAPLFIPSERLDFGVPRCPIALPTDEEVAEILAAAPEQSITINTWSYTAYQVGPIGVTTAANYIPEIWSKYVVQARDQDLVLSKLMGKSPTIFGSHRGDRMPAVSWKALA